VILPWLDTNSIIYLHKMRHMTGDINGTFNYHNIKHINTLFHIVTMYLPKALPLLIVTAFGGCSALYTASSAPIT
jgi:hypothetical protein